MNLASLLAHHARATPDAVAVYRGVERWATYDELSRRVRRLAGGLNDLGLKSGDRVALIMKNCPEYVEAFLAIWHAGLVAVPMNAKLHSSDFAYMLKASGAKLCFVTPDLATAAHAAAKGIPQFQIVEIGSATYRALLNADELPICYRNGADPAWLFFTSGTTGRPKGAVMTHRSLLLAALGYLTHVDPVDCQDRLLHAAPMSHGSGVYIVPYLLRGASQLIPESGGFDECEIDALCRHHSAVSFFAAPTIVKRLTEHGGVGKLPGLRTLVYGGGPMYVEDCLAALDKFGPRLAQIYGQGESPMTITVLSKDDHARQDDPHFMDILASVGRPQTIVEVAVAAKDGKPLAPGQVGEVLVRGDVVMPGYWQDPEATATALEGGWLHTGDMGAMDAHGYLTLKDRSKDVVISGGTNIYPREVEEVLLRHTDVAEVAVVGEPHAEWGEIVVAHVVTRTGSTATADSLDEYCCQNMARFKRPKRYVFADELPKNAYGKILKRALRTRSLHT